MPKISKRRQHPCQQAPVSGASVLSPQARKVSFEEGSSSSSDSLKSAHSSCGTLIPRTSPCTNMFLMNSMFERKPSHTLNLCELDITDESDQVPSRTVSQEEESGGATSPWGQFVDVIPSHQDEPESDWSPCFYEPTSTLSHSSPAYHPYHYTPPSDRLRVSTTGLLPIPNKSSPRRQKLQPRRVEFSTEDVEDALQLLRF